MSTTAAAWQKTKGATTEAHYIATFSGFARVGYFRADWWAVCPDENAGFGLSFCCGPDTTLYAASELAEIFGTTARADTFITAAGGHMAKALASYLAAGLDG